MERISTRLLDELGRIVLPSVSREAFGWDPGAPLDIFEDAANQQVVLRQAAPRCVFCKSGTGLRLFVGKHVCAQCLRAIRES